MKKMHEMYLNPTKEDEVCISEISMLERLRACETRWDAHALIERMKRKELEIIARELYLLPRMYNKEELKDQIVECTVGTRLRSEAIRDIEL